MHRLRALVLLAALAVSVGACTNDYGALRYAHAKAHPADAGDGATDGSSASGDR